MQEQDEFEQFVRSGLARYGVEVDDTELRIIRTVDRVYGPPRDALLSADLSNVEAELDLDPSRPPRDVDR